MSTENKIILVDDTVGILLYKLLSSEIPAGKLETMINNTIMECEQGVHNSPLAQYAAHLAKKLGTAKVQNMTDKLSRLFDAAPKEPESDEGDLDNAIFHRSSEEEIEEELELMRDEIEKAAQKLDPEKDYEKLVDDAKKIDEVVNDNDEDKPTTLEDAEYNLKLCKEAGLLNDEQVNKIKKDMRELKGE